jgi:hypothetical protein
MYKYMKQTCNIHYNFSPLSKKTEFTFSENSKVEFCFCQWNLMLPEK